jgi:NAD(P)-dependent dehydrogenase (short-subunit alcohol dehydrogenase family)
MATKASWTVGCIPDISGKTILVTGGNSGIGYEAARQFAGHGAHVVLACRDARKGHAAVAAITSEHPRASVEAMELDLANLASVRAFAEAYRTRHQRLDVLCNNADVMALPYRRTADGFETQFGTNHLGHFTLAGLLLDLVLRTAGARVARSSVMEILAQSVNRLVAQSAEMGALPTLYVATAPEVRGGDYIGPDGFGELRGYPTKGQSNTRSHDREVAGKLWEISEKLTGVRYVC